MTRTTRARILAIGTELVQGQITNRNAVWISERLTNLGIEVTGHATTPDDRALIREELDRAADASELLIVTGGLGPTTDDFTREVLAAWIGETLVFRDSAWAKIVKRLTERGIEVAESNRAQCYFPTSAVVLENLEGTADGFRFRRVSVSGHATEVLVLPGPPREGQYLWDRFATAWIAETFPPPTPADLETWSCLGKSESSLGEIVERAVAGFDVTTGYRASVPYVEVKIWIPKELARERRFACLAKLSAELAPYSVARNGEDLAGRFLTTIAKLPPDQGLTAIDLGSAGRLAERLISALRTDAGRELRSRTEILTRLPAPGSPDAGPEGLPDHASEWLFALYPDGRVAVVSPRGKRVRTLPNPYPNPAMAERLGGYRAEMALKHWNEIVHELVADGATGASA
jgi:molybdenum cofactor synthesis domain-containing protein